MNAEAMSRRNAATVLRTMGGARDQRTLHSLTRETGLPNEQVRGALSSLESRGLVGKSDAYTDYVLWWRTKLGEYVAEMLAATGAEP